MTQQQRLLSPDVAQQVRSIFESEMKEPVQILYFTTSSGNCMYCDVTEQLLREVEELDDRIHLAVYDLEKDKEMAERYNIDKVPATIIAALNGDEIHDYGIRFFGIPAEYEFSSLLHTITQVSKRESGLSQATEEFLKNLKDDINLRVFVTPSCPYCPNMVMLTHRMAIASPRVTSEMVEAIEFPEWAAEYGVTGVPHTVINDGLGTVIGAVPEGHLIHEIEHALMHLHGIEHDHHHHH
ncbi:MAG: glutaredoxin [Chloroflexi bacterium]|nr:glutaredoxin [Chloroflexota bacterium]